MSVLVQRNGDRATNDDPETGSEGEKMIDIYDHRNCILFWKYDP